MSAKQMYDVIDAGVYTSMDQMTEEHIKAWSDIIVADADGDSDFDVPCDYFDEDMSDIYAQGGLTFIVWLWHRPGQPDVEILDMFCWPGDNQFGGIIIDGKVVELNGDMDLMSYQDSNGTEPSFETMRSQYWCTHREPQEIWWPIVWDKLSKLLGEE